MGKNQTIDLILGITSAVATALLMSLIARDTSECRRTWSARTR